MSDGPLQDPSAPHADNPMLLPGPIDPILNSNTEKVRKRSAMFSLARSVGDFIYNVFKNPTMLYLSEAEKDLSIVGTPLIYWERIVYILAFFDIQLYVKPREETGRDGVTRIVFFVTHGNPRPMSSFKLPAPYAREFFKLDSHARAICSRSFTENKAEFGDLIDQPFKDFNDHEERKMVIRMVGDLLTAQRFQRPEKE
ncbi:Hypothetical protein GL50581_2040 [Giardia duodenalis ATCC 50581]|uniref:Uncharacterized protein n=1 Tax=Giardia intestinalis (strain ATCC 50581 / GS clone H7) TaxID=598745 RepID=C6LTE3_GIAIB|nr:Hypothetical protein GL50581_2040 [Giardia intestinalis ATCC 50581]